MICVLKSRLLLLLYLHKWNKHGFVLQFAFWFSAHAMLLPLPSLSGPSAICSLCVACVAPQSKSFNCWLCDHVDKCDRCIRTWNQAFFFITLSSAYVCMYIHICMCKPLCVRVWSINDIRACKSCQPTGLRYFCFPAYMHIIYYFNAFYCCYFYIHARHV